MGEKKRTKTTKRLKHDPEGGVHLCKDFEGQCVPCPYWYQGQCKNMQKCKFCHIRPREVSLASAIEYYEAVVEDQDDGLRKEGMKWALEEVKKEVGEEAEKRKKAQDADAYIPESLRDVIDDPTSFTQFYSSLPCEGPGAVQRCPNPLIMGSRCVRALHMRITQKVQEVDLDSVGLWLHITQMSQELLSDSLKADAFEGLILESEKNAYGALAQTLLGENDPALGALMQELGEAYGKATEEAPAGPTKNFGGGGGEFHYIVNLIGRLETFLQLGSLPASATGDVTSTLDQANDSQKTWQQSEKERIWQREGSELHAAFLKHIKESRKCEQIEDWLANADATLCLLWNRYDSPDTKGGLSVKQKEEKVARVQRYIVKILQKSKIATEFADAFNNEFGKLNIR